MSTRREIFLRTLRVIGLQDDDLETLSNVGISSLGLIANFDTSELPDTISKGKLKSIQLFQKWLVETRSSQVDSNPVDWSTFTEDAWEDYMISQATKSPSPQVNTDESQEVVDVTGESPKENVTFNTMPSVKIDIRSYPEFDGKLQSWKAFKQKFLSVATIHGIQPIMAPSFSVPSDPPDSKETVNSFTSKNLFLQSILEFSLAKSTASALVKRFNTQGDGRSAWLELVKWFEGQGSQETIAQKALSILATHKLHHNSHGGADLYVEKFENALLDLQLINQPYNMTMAKIQFLENITDTEYSSTKEFLMMDASKSYHDCVMAIRRKSIHLSSQKGQIPSTRRVNNAGKSNSNKSSNRNDNRSSSNNNNSRQVGAGRKKSELWIEPSEWNKMSKDDRDKHLKKVADARARRSSTPAPSNPPPATVNIPSSSGIPPQYGNLNNTITSQERSMLNALQTGSIASANTDELTQQQKTYINMMRSMNNSTVSLNMGRVVSYNRKNESPSVPSVVWRNQLLNELAALEDCEVFSMEDIASAFNAIDLYTPDSSDTSDDDTVSTAPSSDDESSQGSLDLPRQMNYSRIARILGNANTWPTPVIRSSGDLLVDGGCDTSLVGNGFVVESETLRTVNVQGFTNVVTLQELPIVTAVGKIIVDGEPIIIQINEAVYVEGNPTSLLSTFQAREHGVMVNDVAKRHGGTQNIMADGVNIPMLIKNGLLTIPVQAPSIRERDELPRIILTSDQEWTTNSFDESNNIPASIRCNNISIDSLFSTYKTDESSKVFLHPFRSKEKAKRIEYLTRKMAWIPEHVMKKTLDATTMLAKNYLNLPLRRHFKSRYPQLNRNRLRERYSTDTFFSSVPAILTGATCAQIFVGAHSTYTAVYPMRNESHGPEILETFIANVGAPYHLMNDNAKMQTSEAWNKILRKYNISSSTTEPYHPWQNRSERRIQDVKRMSNRIMIHTSCPHELWTYCIMYSCDILNHTASKTLGWRTPIEVAFGITPDISALVQFAFYEPVYYYASDPFPTTKELPGRFLGVAKNVGDALTYWVLTQSNQVIARSVLREAVPWVDVCDRVDSKGAWDDGEVGIQVRKRIKMEEETLAQKFADDFKTTTEDYDETYFTYAPKFDLYHYNGEDLEFTYPEEFANDHKKNTESKEPLPIQTRLDIVGTNPIAEVNPDELIGFNLPMLNEETGLVEKATVTEYDPNEASFIVKFVSNGDSMITYNDLVNQYNKRDEENSQLYTFKKIVDHKMEGNTLYVEVLWDTDEKTFEKASEIKKTDPVTLAKYILNHHLERKHGCKWAQRYKRDPKVFINLSRMFAARNKITNRFKFGVMVPQGIRQAKLFDANNRNTLWSDAMDKEMNELMKMETFIILDDKSMLPEGYKYIPVHFVFDVKVDGRHKARLCAGGDHTNPDTSEVFSSVVSIENVRMLFLLADLNNLQIVAADISNAYLHAYTREKVWTTLKHGRYQNKCMQINKAQYGLCTSAARWAEALSLVLQQINFKQSKADMDIWMRKNDDVWEYIAVYVDDLIVIAKDAMAVLNEVKLKGKFDLKGVGKPEYYLGGDIYRSEDPASSIKTTMSAKTYLKNICDKIERVFGTTLRNYGTPLEAGYHPELDGSELLDDDDTTKYRMLTGSLNWAVTIGRVDVMFAATTMARYNHAPRAGHLKVMLRIFGYLKYHIKGAIRIDTSYPPVPETTASPEYWKKLYPEAAEKIPDTYPEALGKPVQLWLEFDSDHAHDLETRRSVTGVLLFINNTLVKWYCKRQSTVETSTYGAEINACKTAGELVIEYRYKLRMLGVPLKDKAFVYGDNLSVIINGSRPESVLKKKTHACYFHFIRELCAASLMSLHKIDSKENRSDALTKSLAGGPFYHLMKSLLFSKSDNDQRNKFSDDSVPKGECQK